MTLITTFFSALFDKIYAFIAEKLGEEYAREAVPLSAFVGGFAWDALTLSRIDQWFDQTILTAYLIGSFFMLRLDQFPEKSYRFNWQNWTSRHAGFIFHFFIGGLFSAYVVFVFKSVTLSKSLIFFVLVVAVFVLNEWAARQRTSLLSRLSMIYLAAFMYLVFILPLFTGRIDYPVFLAAGILSGLAVFVFARDLIQKTEPSESVKRVLQKVVSLIVGMALLLNIFYMLKWMPPVPLVLKEAVLATYVSRALDGDYEVKTIDTPWWTFWRSYEDTYPMSVGKIYCFASVFAPTRINTTLVHDWQFDDPKKGWTSVDKIRYTISGGRDGGYRGYTFKSTLRPGNWRVFVKTEDGRIVGKIGFEITE